MGLYFGEENASTGRSAENEKGFWERRDVRMINDSILFTADCDWDLVSKFDAGMIPTETNAGHKSAIADVVVKLDAHRPWFVKEPRLCVTFPIWRATLEQPICIHIGRNPLEVAHSLNARNGIPVRVGLALWEFYNTRALQAASGLPLLSVSYEDLVGAPDRTVDSIRVYLAEQDYRVRMPSTSELSGFLDANLRHHRKEPAALSHVATAHQLHLYHLLSSHTSPVSEPDDVSKKCLETLARYESTANVADRRRLAQQRRMRRRRSEMELQIALRDVELRHALGAARQLETRATHLQGVRRNLETQLAASNERVRTLQNERAAIQRDVANKVAHLQDVRRNLETQLAATNERVRTLQNERAAIQRDVANKVAHLQDVRRNLETQLAATNERVRTLQNERAAIQRDVQEVANKVAHLQDVRRNLEAQLAASNERVRTLRDDKTILQQHKANHDKLVTRHDQLKQDLGQRQRQTAELERRYHRLERERRSLQLEHAESVHGGKRDRKEVRAVRRKNAELHVRQLRMERELHHFRRQVAVLEGAKSANQKVYSRKSPVAPNGVADAPVESRNTRPRPRPPIGVGGIDVVVCVHNALEYVQRCLESVLSRSTVKFRVVIVNDGSDQPTTDWLRGLSSRFDRVDLVETHGPIGYTRAANLGLRATQADRVVLLNSDTIVPRLWLEGLLECMASDDKIGIVGPLSNAATWQSVPERVDKSGGWAVNALPQGYNVDEFAELVLGISERQFPRVPFLNGFCLLISRAVIDQIGYLDEESFPRGYGEENDYCIRAHDAGFLLAIADHCFVYHAKSKSFGTSARDELAKAGRIALHKKFGEDRIQKSSREIKDSSSLERIRNSIKKRAQAVRRERYRSVVRRQTCAPSFLGAGQRPFRIAGTWRQRGRKLRHPRSDGDAIHGRRCEGCYTCPIPGCVLTLL